MLSRFQFLLLVLFLIQYKGTASPITCPTECQCTIDGLSFFVDCSNSNLSKLPSFSYKKIHFLDLSNNLFKTFPDGIKALEGLEYLDISHNQISRLSENTLHNLTSLRFFDLGYNKFSNWLDINPKDLLLPALNLDKLTLAGNHFTSLSSADERLILFSPTLIWLDISNCQIAKVVGEYIFSGIPNLESINLSNNPIHSVSDIISNSITSIDMSSCKLEILSSTVFQKVPKLTTLILANNSRISLAPSKRLRPGISFPVSSNSLKYIDISYCNINNVELDGFPQLTTAVLRHNMIKYLDEDSFSYNPLLEVIDLSMNSISRIEGGAFSSLLYLKQLDLSYNIISQIDRDTFKYNSFLLSINLSRNYIGKFARWSMPSIKKLNISGCEILQLERDALAGMPEVHDIDMSNNLLSDLLPYMSSNKLHTLNFKNNRIVSIRNTTFFALPELTKLNLAGNRLTTSLKRKSFTQNRYLQQIWLGDNPWVCDCTKTEFFDFYQYLVEPPIKISDRYNIKCFSPDHVYGKSWESACYEHWYNADRKFGIAERIWIGVMFAVIICSALFCCYITVKRGMEGRELTRREREREENLAEITEIARQTRMRLEQEAQLNAPDPRENNPPAYEEAIRMPKPIFSSLDELSMKRIKKKRKLRKATNDQEEEEETFNLRRHHYRSEEVLSPRTSTRVVPRLHPFEIEDMERKRVLGDVQEFEEYCTFESRNGSPYTKRKGEDSRRESPFKRRDASLKKKRLISNSRTDSTNEVLTDEEHVVKASELTSVVFQIRKSKENLVDKPGPSISLEASQCLDEEFKLLDEMELKNMKENVYFSDSDSSNNEIQLISRVEIETENLSIKSSDNGSRQDFVIISNQR